MSSAHDMSRALGADLRVILVGRSPMEAKLRRDPRLELLRARSPVDAIGELADPIDEGSPSRTVVIVSPGAVHNGESAAFAGAVRQVDPQALLVAVTENGAPDAAPAGFDLAIPGNADGERLRSEVAELRRRPSVARPAAHTKPARPQAPAPAQGATGADEPADAESRLLRTLLAGRDPVEACITLQREELGCEDLCFVSATDGQEAPASGVPVERHGKLFGWLEAPGVAQGALRGAAGRLALWLSLAEQHRQLRRAAFTDPLTGAWNRRYFDHFLALAIDSARNRRRDLTVLLFDIDDFKLYNDRYGHAAGDQILRETVRLLESVIRPTDLVCRIGGDEFAVIFNEPEGPRTPTSRHPASIGAIAARFQRQICDHRFPKLGAEAQGTLTISGGLASFPWDGQTPESLLQRADELALESKRQGKNVVTFGPNAEPLCDDGSSFPGAGR